MRVVATAMVGALAAVSLPPVSAYGQSAASQGSWTTLPYTMPINPIHCGVLSTGKVLIVAGSENEPAKHNQKSSVAAVWDPATGSIIVQSLPWDVFCNGMACLTDGRFEIVGGSEQYDPFYGEARATIFDPATEKFNQVESMAHGRWYATVTALSDGGLMAFSGLNETGGTNKAVEIYHVGSGWSPEYVAPWSPPLYPRMHLLPSGKVFYSGEEASSNLFTPSTHTWAMGVARTVYGQSRGYGSSVLLPLRPEDGYVARVLIMGGHNPATPTAEVIDLSAPTPAWRNIAPMSKPRIQMNATILPSGKVLALGGSLRDEDASTASLAADLFDPANESWSPAGVEVYPRLYHSVSLLMPDATVWVAGSNPTRGTYEKHMEVYSPAYLFTTDGGGNVVPAVRPTIAGVASEIGYGSAFGIQTPDAADIGSAVLVRPGSSSHAFDMEQRLVGLSFSNSGPGLLSATAPPNGSIAPPGYYMLFILNRAGVPSVARFVHLTSTPTDGAPDGVITSPVSNVTIVSGQSVNFAGSATDPDGPVTGFSWIFPDGSPEASSAQSPGAVRFTEVGTHVISMTAIDSLGVNDPSPPTRTITVLPVPLQVRFTQPAPGSTVGGKKMPVGLSATGTTAGSNTFTFSVDGNLEWSRTTTGTSVSFNWNAARLSSGPHVLSATVRDAGGNTGSTSETVYH